MTGKPIRSGCGPRGGSLLARPFGSHTSVRLRRGNKIMLAMILGALLAAQVLMPVGAGQEAGAAKLPETEAGRRVAAYFKAFNSGEEAAMGAYFEANVSPELLRKRPVEKRLEVYRRVRAGVGGPVARRGAAGAGRRTKT